MSIQFDLFVPPNLYRVKVVSEEPYVKILGELGWFHHHPCLTTAHQAQCGWNQGVQKHGNRYQQQDAQGIPRWMGRGALRDSAWNRHSKASGIPSRRVGDPRVWGCRRTCGAPIGLDESPRSWGVNCLFAR